LEIKKTPLYDYHIKLNAVMVEFAGFFMPVHYGSILEETKHTRQKISIFDIFHMGEFYIKENPEKSSLDYAITVPVVKMKNGKCKYGFLLNENGTIIDDLIVYRISNDEWMIVVNASNEKIDEETLKKRLSNSAYFENRSNKIMKIDVQGPLSREIIKKIAGEKINNLKYYTFDKFDFMGDRYIISRTGYTGELGYEIYIDAEKTEELWKKLLSFNDVKPAGLGARDILRLEMGYPLYGDELTSETTPLDAGFQKFLDFEKDFAGKKALLNHKQKYLLCGFIVNGRKTIRHNGKVFINEKEIGYVTSGVFSPHLNCAIGMAYVLKEFALENTEIFLGKEKPEISGKIIKPPFLKNTSLKS